MESAVKISNLTVLLGGHFKAIDQIDLDLPTGKIVGVIGPSGAGKTTLIRAIVGRVQTSSGNITVFGLPAGSTKLREQLSYMTQELSVYSDLTVEENIRYFVTMTGQPRGRAKVIIQEVLKAVDITDKAASLVRDLSGGQKQRVSLAIALIGDPKLMVLDEPTVGLDPVLRENLWRLFGRLADQGRTLIVSSHAMDEAERCDDIVLIRDGRLVAHSSPEQLRHSTNTETIEESFLKLVREKQ